MGTTLNFTHRKTQHTAIDDEKSALMVQAIHSVGEGIGDGVGPRLYQTNCGAILNEEIRMIESIIGLAKKDLSDLITKTAARMGVHPAIVEKDIWVCVVLERRHRPHS